MFGLAPPGHVVEIHTGIKGVLMFGDENLARPTSSRLAIDIFKRPLTLIRDLQRCEIPRILTNPLSRLIFGAQIRFAHMNNIIDVTSSFLISVPFGTPWRLRTKLLAGHCDYQDILPLTEYSCNEHHGCAFSRRPHIQLHGKDLGGRHFTARCSSKLYNILISREIGNRCLHFFLLLQVNIGLLRRFGMTWDFVATFYGSAT